MNVNSVFLSTLPWSEITIYVLLGAIGCLFLSVLLYTIISSKKQSYNVSKSPSTFSITIDYKLKRVTYFNKKTLKEIVTITLDDYYSFFDKKSREELSNLIERTIQNVDKDIDKVLEANSVHNAYKMKSYFSVVEINSVDIEKQIIHISQYFFDKIPLTHYQDLKKETRYRSMFYVAENNVKIKFKNSNPTRGASFYFSIQYINTINTGEKRIFVYYYLLNLISKYVNQNRVLLKDESTGAFILHDFKINKHFNTFKLISKIRKDFVKFIELNGFDDRVKFSIAIVEHKYFPKDYSKTMKALKQTANEAINKNRDFLFYDNQNKSEFYFDQSYKSEIESIIKNHSLKYHFSPILYTSRNAVIGYFSKVEPISTIFSDIGEVKEYAYKLSISKELFTEMAKYLCAKFLNGNRDEDDTYLFYSLNANEIDYANSILGYIGGVKKVNLVLLFNESDLLKNLTNDEGFIDSFRKLSSKGYKLGLEITIKTLELPDELYNLFDFFTFDSKYFEENFEDISHSSMTLKRSIEKVLRYKKRIVVSNVNTWNDFEIRQQENLKLLQGNIIAPYNEMIIPISKKTLDKIKKIKKRG